MFQNKSPARWQIFVHGLGKTIVVDCNRHDTILQLKEKIADREGVPADMQALTHGCRTMSDSHTLQDHNLTTEVTIHVTVRPPPELVLPGRLNSNNIYIVSANGNADKLQVFLRALATAAVLALCSNTEQWKAAVADDRKRNPRECRLSTPRRALATFLDAKPDVCATQRSRRVPPPIVVRATPGDCVLLGVKLRKEAREVRDRESDCGGTVLLHVPDWVLLISGEGEESTALALLARRMDRARRSARRPESGTFNAEECNQMISMLLAAGAPVERCILPVFTHLTEEHIACMTLTTADAAVYCQHHPAPSPALVHCVLNRIASQYGATISAKRSTATAMLHALCQGGHSEALVIRIADVLVLRWQASANLKVLVAEVRAGRLGSLLHMVTTRAYGAQVDGTLLCVLLESGGKKDPRYGQAVRVLLERAMAGARDEAAALRCLRSALMAAAAGVHRHVPAVAGRPPLKLRAQRQAVLPSLFPQLGDDWRRPVKAVIDGEHGAIDAGGVTRELLSIAASAMLDADTNMFRAVDGAALLPSDTSGETNPDHAAFFELAGKLAGLALSRGECLPGVFLAPPLLRALLCCPGLASAEDEVRECDAELHRHKYLYVRSCSADELASLDLCFVASRSLGTTGLVLESELVQGGEMEPVTVRNRERYLAALAAFAQACTSQQCGAFARGAHAVVDRRVLAAAGQFLRAAPAVLAQLIGGEREIDVEQWRAHTRYSGGYSADAPQVGWLWELVEEMDQRWRSGLLRFATGTSAPPAGGFGHLMGMTNEGAVDADAAPCCFCISRTPAPTPDNMLSAMPRGHTCFNTLDLPAFIAREELRAALANFDFDAAVHMDDADDEGHDDDY
jgi:hypothetical protein